MKQSLTLPEDFSELAVQWRQRHVIDLVNPEYLEMVSSASISISIRSDDDTLVAICGVSRADDHRAELWSVLSRHSGVHLLAITRLVREHIDRLDFERLELFCDPDFDQAARWARLLGFELEGRRKSYTARGDMDCWVRFKNG